MKKFIFPSFMLFTFIASAQTFVSTSVENKNIILEEFTGISCGYCPDGHLIGQNLHDANPNDVFLINIHTGSYATPQGPGTDFNTNFGAAIAGQSGLSGYPAGTVNRHQFTMTQGGGTAMSRGDWGSASTQLLSQISPVNVGLQASIDMATNTLTVDVEVYYTGSQTITTNSLNIAIVQNGILGPQSGGATYNPTAIDPATGLYTHKHMLRHMLTGQWGEYIQNLTPGTLYSNTYTWTIPNQISGYPLSPDIDATNIAVVAFVSEGNQEILSGTEIYPSLVFVNSYDANLISSSATDIMCVPATDLTVTFKNYGNINLTTLDIEYSINGGSVITYPWIGNLSSGASETVVIQNITVTPTLTNTVDVSLVSPNGQTDQNLSNNDLQCTFDGMYDAPAGQITIEVTTDGYPAETSWKLKENGVVIATSPVYTSTGTAQAPVTATVSSGNNCYTFVMMDSYGDGLLSPGFYKVTDVNGGVIIWGGTNSPNGNFTSEESTYFESNSGVTPTWDCDGQGSCYDPGNGLGQYSSLGSCQANCITPSWNCINGTTCIDPGNGNGQYSSLASCQSSCVTPTWDCVNGSCIDPGTGNGTFASLAACQGQCVAVTYDCVNNACIDPGTGNGTFTSLAACQGQCVAVTYDCVNNACIDPGTGNGTFASLTSCQANCVSTSIISQDIGYLNIYPNPTNGILNIQFSILNSQDIRLNLVNTIGEIVFTESLSNYLGEYKRQINLEEYSKGVYLLELDTDNGIVNKKLILQ